MSAPSKFADGLSRRLTHGLTEKELAWGTGIIDQALAPVRECLEGLRDGGCWCGVTPASDDEIVPAIYRDHSDACLTAQQLYERLKQS